MSNKYGLILPDKAKPNKPKFKATRNVFGDDSESEEEGSKKSMLLRPSHNVQRQAKLTQEKAVLEDPTVYQYDEIYDSMVTKKEETTKPKEERKPKYIENLLKTAQKRKIENERRIERQVQKEREKEGDEFADKEVFVTSAYKKKLEELRLEEEKERREEYLENIGDVTKQSDLGGFYRHIYEQRMGSEKTNKESTTNVEPQEAIVKKDDEPADDINSKQVKNKLSSSKKSAKEKSEGKSSRNYRKRKSSTDRDPMLSEGEIVETDGEVEINRVNLQDIREAKKMKKETEDNIDADSDFSVDESSDGEDTAKDVKISENQDSKDNVGESGVQPTTQSEKEQEKEDSKEIKIEETPAEPKPKIDIWKKRTVGVVFEEALKRYYERKAARG